MCGFDGGAGFEGAFDVLFVRFDKETGEVETFSWRVYPEIFHVLLLQQNSSVIIIYEITRTKTRHHRIREIGLPVNVQSLQLLSDGRLCVGSPSCFTVYDIQNPDQQLTCKWC